MQAYTEAVENLVKFRKNLKELSEEFQKAITAAKRHDGKRKQGKAKVSVTNPLWRGIIIIDFTYFTFTEDSYNLCQNELIL